MQALRLLREHQGWNPGLQIPTALLRLPARPELTMQLRQSSLHHRIAARSFQRLLRATRYLLPRRVHRRRALYRRQHQLDGGQTRRLRQEQVAAATVGRGHFRILPERGEETTTTRRDTRRRRLSYEIVPFFSFPFFPFRSS